MNNMNMKMRSLVAFAKLAKGSLMENKRSLQKNQRSFLAPLLAPTMTMIMTAASALGMWGCAAQTNPTSDYPELADYVPKGERPPVPTLEFIDPRYFPIETCKKAVPVDTCGYINFVEGRTDTYYFKPRLMLSGVEYELVAPPESSGLPEGAKFEKATEPDRAGQYALTWTPPVGTLANKQVDRPYKFQLQVKVLNKPDPKAAALMQKIGNTREMEMRLVRTDEQPVITKITDAKNEVVDMKGQVFNEGEGARVYNVIVRDVGAHAGDTPYLYVRKERNGSQESAKVDGTQFVKGIGEPKSLGDSQWQFSLVIDPSGVALPAGTGPVTARFLLAIDSPSPVRSPEQVVEFRINRKVAPAAAPSSTTSPKTAK